MCLKTVLRMVDVFYSHLREQEQLIRNQGLFKEERIIASPQSTEITLADGRKVLNFCANNYLGLADHPEVIRAAQESYKHYGFGLASVRFICGTQTVHKELEHRLSSFFRMEDTILYSSCFDANGGVFETLFGPDDAIISDALNHASIIDGIRLCKAQRYRYAHNDMADLEKQLTEAKNARFRVIATDGVFSMDGTIANLKAICDLADKYKALVMVDDCHATGFMGKGGRGTPEHCGIEGRIDILTGTLGKALGGSSGGYISGRKELIGWLRQRSRPYLFSNTLAPSIAAATLKVLELVEKGDKLRETLRKNTALFREKMMNAGFTILPVTHPIVPVMLGDAKLAQQYAAGLLDQGIYAVGFFYPVVPEGKARIRVQLSAAHTEEQINRAVQAFISVKDAVPLLKGH